MILTFYQNQSDNKVIDKTLSQMTQKTATLKDDTSMINPEFELAYDSEIVGSNYLHCDKFDRFYYIEDIVYGSLRIYVRCRVDVLMSFKESIMASYGIIKRDGYHFNTYLNDEHLKIYGYRNNVIMNSDTTPFSKGGSFLLAVSG